jgi:hypothetical protein
MPKSRRPYAPAFRERLIELVHKGRMPAELARQFEPSAQAIRNWVRQAVMYAARWPDGIRGDPTWDHPEWHYINVPLTRDGVSGSPPATPPNILTALEQASEVLRKPGSTDAEKAVALCWLFHLVGDVHQPLHTVSLFSALCPEGDRGGMRFYVRVGPSSATVSLHYLWDNALGQQQGIRAVWNRCGVLGRSADLARDSFPEFRLGEWASWVAESVQHARDTAYPSGMAGSRDPANGLLLPPDYGTHAQALAERQIVLAGYRLADLVTRLLRRD